MSRFHKDGNEINFVAAGTEVIGGLIQIAGTVGIVNPTHDGANPSAGDDCVARIKGIVEVPNSGIAPADGTAIGYDQSADEAVAAAGGDFDIGHAVGAHTVNDAFIKVLLPGPASP